MIVGVQKSGSGFEKRWPEFIVKHGAEARELDLRASDGLDQARACNAVMWHIHHDPQNMRVALPLLRVIEQQLGKVVSPDQRTVWHFDDKIAQSYLLQALALPQPETHIFWSRDTALAWAERAQYPVVAKLSCGAGSSNVKLVHDATQARVWIDRMFSRSGVIPVQAYPRGTSNLLIALHSALRCARRCASVPAYVLGLRGTPLPRQYWMPQRDYALFQEFLPGNEHDTRVTVIGNRAFAFRRLNRANDFRASGSGKIDHDMEQIDLRCVRLAFDAATRLQAQSVAFDFLHRGAQRDPVIIEFCYAYLSSAVMCCPGHWDRDLVWHPGSMWPEEAHVIDLLERIRMKRT